MYTSHGHHISGTTKANPPSQRARCGGPGLCKACSTEYYMVHQHEHPQDQSEVQLHLKEISKVTTEIQPQKFTRRVFSVEAVRVTEENFEAIAKWCNGRIVTVKSENDEGTTGETVKHIEVNVLHPMNRRQSQAYVGDWVLYAFKGFRVYGHRAFQKNFEQVQPETIEVDPPQELMVTNEPVKTDEPQVVTVQDSEESVNVS